MDSPSSSSSVPSSVLIVGSGVFGLSTAWALCKNPLFKDTTITLVDRQTFPTPDGASIDTSRIIRPDYASPPYTRLASRAQNLWRTTFAPEHYHETGLCLVGAGKQLNYVNASLANVQALATDNVEVCKDGEDIKRVTGTSNASGEAGYVNWSSGWADAEGAMIWLRKEVEAYSRVKFVTSTVSKLLIDHATSVVSGVTLSTNPPTTLTASLTILAAGAWSASLLDLRGICKATGQAIAYMPISPAEEASLRNRPTLLNLSNGLFMIPPSRGLLKIARHGHGYANPTTIRHPESEDPNETITVSLPYTAIDDPSQQIAPEAWADCRQFLTHIHPSLSTPTRPFTKSKICWYTDTRDGDFLISYHPKYKGLFVATGGSGHGFKFLPVIGDSILECVLGETPDDFKGKWDWPMTRVPEDEWEGDGSRGGPMGLILSEEMSKARASKL
ncbi:FAD dependent oxidoreductase [Aaosphaeria arxii CBS 175.79]|uniref:FAD dependent oxidoreductase n=1 Tax=Aaosphaeria arxii CBS 175.79 TaxID=1450172 RepID=A0A6A5YAD1_9PLEO|nr:FAD dependent oxidoreductase [Aaosphaeria arxii CBS 175.79]KAF2021544.1 FAD dependent oxidoreductase [Aaosphaeria arxii CBS 175.79]